MSEDTKVAEQRGYSRGYRSGRARRMREVTQERLRRERQALLDRIYIAMLPAAMQVQGWKRGDKPITDMNDRITLAREWAEKAMERRPIA